MRFADVLDRKAEEIKRPKPLPAGHYILAVAAHPETGEISDGKFDTLTFQMTVVQALNDVDPDELEAFGNIVGQRVRKQFLFNTDPAEEVAFTRSLNNVKAFLQHCEIGFTDDMQVNEGLAACVGAQVKGEVIHRADKNDPEVIYTEVGRTAPV